MNDTDLILKYAKFSKYLIKGDSYNDWIIGLYKDGVYWCVHKYNLALYFAESPDAVLHNGNQDARYGGNPFPRGSKLTSITEAPDWLKEKILKTVSFFRNHLMEIKCKRDNEDKVEKEYKQSKIEIERQRILENWKNGI